ncbi:uncharacterized protein TNCV_5117071 [Trichonephila clavipes]|nr:uncharacterized protein TNCV_5117071 [Trichonephila clavipes]
MPAMIRYLDHWTTTALLKVAHFLKRALESYEKPDHCGPIPRHLERVVAVARFRLPTGHDFLEVYLIWFDLATDEVCPLYGHARMDGDPCSNALDSMNTRLTMSSGGLVSNGKEANSSAQLRLQLHQDVFRSGELHMRGGRRLPHAQDHIAAGRPARARAQPRVQGQDGDHVTEGRLLRPGVQRGP